MGTNRFLLIDSITHITDTLTATATTPRYVIGARRARGSSTIRVHLSVYALEKRMSATLARACRMNNYCNELLHAVQAIRAFEV